MACGRLQTFSNASFRSAIAASHSSTMGSSPAVMGVLSSTTHPAGTTGSSYSTITSKIAGPSIGFNTVEISIPEFRAIRTPRVRPTSSSRRLGGHPSARNRHGRPSPRSVRARRIRDANGLHASSRDDGRAFPHRRSACRHKDRRARRDDSTRNHSRAPWSSVGSFRTRLPRSAPPPQATTTRGSPPRPRR